MSAGESSNISVFCRVRPTDSKGTRGGGKNVCRVEDAKSVIVGKHSHSFSFDWVGGPDASQVQVYEAICKPLVQSFLSGYVAAQRERPAAVSSCPAFHAVCRSPAAAVVVAP